MKRLLLILPVVFVMASCQKEIDLGTGANDYADLLVKALQITPATNDTNTITFQWDKLRRLLVYKSAGKVNGQPTNINHTITRLSDGKIAKIISTSSLGAGFSDSVVYFPTYQTGSTRLDYVIDTQYTIIGTLVDSVVYKYNGSGQVISKETFSDDLFGSMIPSGKQVYTYGGSGNLAMVTDSVPDGAGGYDPGTTTIYTYDLHKSMVTLGEECFIVLDPSNVSKNNFTKQVVNDDSGANIYTSTSSQLQFNAADRPIKISLSLTPQPPGYNLKLILSYQ